MRRSVMQTLPRLMLLISIPIVAGCSSSIQIAGTDYTVHTATPLFSPSISIVDKGGEYLGAFAGGSALDQVSPAGAALSRIEAARQYGEARDGDEVNVDSSVDLLGPAWVNLGDDHDNVDFP